MENLMSEGSKKSSEYSDKLLLKLHSLWSSKKFCDVELSAGGYTVKAHRLILSAASPYFKVMFTSGLSEETQKEIRLNSLKPKILSHLINFIYTGDIEVTKENAEELIVAADMLELKDVLSICTKFIQDSLTPENSLGIYRFSEDHNLSELHDFARDFVHCNFLDVVKHDEFLEIPKETLTSLLSSESLRIQSEIQVFNAALNWLLKSVKSRIGYASEVFRLVRIPLIPFKDLESKITECCDSLFYPRLTVTLIKDLKVLVDESVNLVPFIAKPRVGARQKIFVYGYRNVDDKYVTNDIVAYDTSTDKWQSVSSWGDFMRCPGFAILNGKIYVVGGDSRYYGFLNRCDVYDIKETSWARKADILNKRSDFGLCALGDYLYAFGGAGRCDAPTSVERYDPNYDVWEMYAEFPEKQSIISVEAYNGLIYIVGRSPGKRFGGTIKSFNPLTREWISVTSIANDKHCFSVAVLDGYLYVVGGREDILSNILSSVDRYSLKENKWLQCLPMTVAGANLALTAANGKLFAIGGNDQKSYFRNYVECYDPKTDSWSHCAPLPPEFLRVQEASAY